MTYLKMHQNLMVVHFRNIFFFIDLSMLSMLGKNFSRQHFEIFFFFVFSENMLWHFMQIVSLGDNLHEIPKPTFWEK